MPLSVPPDIHTHHEGGHVPPVVVLAQEAQVRPRPVDGRLAALAVAEVLEAVPLLLLLPDVRHGLRGEQRLVPRRIFDLFKDRLGH